MRGGRDGEGEGRSVLEVDMDLLTCGISSSEPETTYRLSDDFRALNDSVCHLVLRKGSLCKSGPY